MLTEKLWDNDYIKASNEFYVLMADQKKLMAYYELCMEARKARLSGTTVERTKEEQAKLDAAQQSISHVRSILNDRELVAIGIRERTYDDAIYRRWWFSTYIQEWQKAQAFVLRLRNDEHVAAKGASYSEMEALANRWRSEGPWTDQRKHIRLPFGRSLVITRSR